MEHLTLRFCPLTCARVTMVALEQSGADLAPYPAVAAHGARVAAQPSFRRMVEREGAAMAKAGIAPGPAHGPQSQDEEHE